MTVRLTSISFLVFILAGCAADEWNNEDIAGITQAGVKGNGGVNGDSHFCIDPAFPCVTGEGDCDNDGQCDVGLVCARDNGAQFGFSTVTDVCVPPHCTNEVQDADETAIDCGGADCGTSCGGICDGLPPAPDRNHCTPTCPCVAGDADCDGDNECQTGLVCGTDLGDQFGFATTVDVCVAAHCTNGVLDADETAVDCGGADCGGNCGMDCGGEPPNGQPGHCTLTCQCMQNHGDCDADDNRCLAPFVCIEDSGATFGFGAGIDMCLPAHCESGVTDGDETGVDCGGSCADCVIPVTAYGGGSNDRPFNVAMDTAGNMVVAGRFDGTSNFGGSNLVSNRADIFVAKYTASGAHLWSFAFGAGGNDGDNDVDVAVGPNGEIAVTGNFYQTVNFGGVNLTSNGGPDAFVLMLEANGTTRWATSFGAAGIDVGRSVAVRPNGEVIAVGSFEQTVNFGAGGVASAGGRDMFVVRLSGAAGAHLASTTFGGTGKDTAYGVTVNSTNVFVAGAFMDTVNFGSIPLTSNGAEDGFVSRMSATTLVPSTAFQIGGTNGDIANRVAIDGSNRMYITGQFKVMTDFGGGAVMAAGGVDAYLLALTATGGFRWVSTFGDTGNDRGRRVVFDSNRNEIVLTGTVQGTVSNFPGGVEPDLGGSDSFLIRYTTGGGVVASQRDGGTGTDEGFGVAANSTGLAYTGRFSGTADIGGTNVSSAGAIDMFLAKL